MNWLRLVKNDMERSQPNVFRLSWEPITDIKEYVVDISETEDFSSSVRIFTKENFCEIDNLKIGQQYFYKINNEHFHTFKTKGDAPRFIRIDGVLNVRDLGGNKIKQGILYRGSALDSPFAITEKGKYTFRNVLKIRTELDLRREVQGRIISSAAGNDIQYVWLPYNAYKEVFEKEHQEEICRIMEFLSLEKNYPIYVHCMGGADRTGMIALFLRALAGESDDDIHLDYELTSLSTFAAYGAKESPEGFRQRTAGYYVNFLKILKTYAPNQPLSMQVKNFLLDCGVTEETINKIIKIIKI